MTSISTNRKSPRISDFICSQNKIPCIHLLDFFLSLLSGFPVSIFVLFFFIARRGRADYTNTWTHCLGCLAHLPSISTTSIRNTLVPSHSFNTHALSTDSFLYHCHSLMLSPSSIFSPKYSSLMIVSIIGTPPSALLICSCHWLQPRSFICL
jgi:hypothetical protein